MKRGRPKHDDILTPREWQVLKLVREGLTNEAIAGRLGISFAAAKYHVAEIMSKLGVSSRHEAVQRIDEEKQGRWSALPMVAWLRRGGAVRKTAALAFGGSAVVALLLLAGVLSFGGGSLVHIDESALGLDEGSAAQQANDRAQAASPYKHTILLTKTTPQNVGDASAIIASMRTVGSIDELKAALAMTRDVNLIVVDQSAVPELEGGDFLYQQIKSGKAIIELNACLAQVHYMGGTYESQPASQGGVVTEIDPQGNVRKYDVLPGDPSRMPHCYFADRWQEAGYAYFGVRRAASEGQAADGRGLEPGTVNDTIVNSTVADREQLGLFESAVTQLDADPHSLVFPAPDCETAKADGAAQGISVTCP